MLDRRYGYVAGRAEGRKLMPRLRASGLGGGSSGDINFTKTSAVRANADYTTL